MHQELLYKNQISMDQQWKIPSLQALEQNHAHDTPSVRMVDSSSFCTSLQAMAMAINSGRMEDGEPT